MTKWSKLFVAALVAIGLTACGNSGSEGGGGGEQLVLGGTADPQIAAQMIIADERGYFDEHDVDVKVQLFPTGPELVQAVAAGDVKVFGTSSVPAWNLKTTGSKVEIISQLADMSGGFGIAVQPGIKDVGDLEGKKVGLVPGTALESMLSAALEDAGVDEATVTKVTLDGPSMLTALERNEIDAAVLYEPWMVRADDVGASVLVTADTGSPRLYGEHSVLLGEPSFLKDNSAQVKSVLAALKQAQDDIVNDPEDAAAAIGERLQLDPEEVLTMLSENKYKMDIDQVLIDDFNRSASYLEKFGKIDSHSSVEDWIDSSYLADFDASLVQGDGS